MVSHPCHIMRLPWVRPVCCRTFSGIPGLTQSMPGATSPLPHTHTHTHTHKPQISPVTAKCPTPGMGCRFQKVSFLDLPSRMDHKLLSPGSCMVASLRFTQGKTVLDWEQGIRDTELGPSPLCCMELRVSFVGCCHGNLCMLFPEE